jgi:hypothetical protein
MHQGKNGFAFVEVLLARKIYFGEVGFLPFFRSYKFWKIGSDRIPLLLAKIGNEQYINHGDLVECANF